MDSRQRQRLRALAEGDLRFDCPMAEYTTFRVGGKAEVIYTAERTGALKAVLAYFRDQGIPYLTVGNGSNLLVGDNGLEGVVIRLGKWFSRIEPIDGGGSLIDVGAGLDLKALLTYCRDKGMGGLEFLAGIPGSVGGAVAMNSGAFGAEIGDRVRRVEVLTPGGELVERDRQELTFSYRHLSLEKGTIILKVRLEVEAASRDSVREKMAAVMEQRVKTQPMGIPSAGSVFKNPPGEYAAGLIDRCGLKGKKRGGAMVSEQHANYILNTGGATARDILDLISLVQEKVLAETGIRLEPEIQVVGR